MTDNPDAPEFPPFLGMKLRETPAGDKSLPFEVRYAWVVEHLGLGASTAGVLLAILDGRPYGDVIRGEDFADRQQTEHPEQPRSAGAPDATDSR